MPHAGVRLAAFLLALACGGWGGAEGRVNKDFVTWQGERLPENSAGGVDDAVVEQVQARNVITAVLEIPIPCRLRHHLVVEHFVERRAKDFPTLHVSQGHGDPRLIFLEGERIRAIVVIIGWSAAQIEETLADYGTIPVKP